MEKLRPATSIKIISKYTLIYQDEDGIEQTINLVRCRDNWYESHYRKESLIGNILKKRKKCKYVSDRFWGYDEAYFLFYSEIKIRFFFDLNDHMESDDTTEVRQCFGHIEELLENAGWLTFDIG